MYLCPTCRTLLDYHHGVNSEEGYPKEGSIILCAYCATICQVSDNKLNLPDPDVFIEVLNMEGIPDVIAKLRYSIKNNPNHPKPKPVGEV
jgi:hypothetical protein